MRRKCTYCESVLKLISVRLNLFVFGSCYRSDWLKLAWTRWSLRKVRKADALRIYRLRRRVCGSRATLERMAAACLDYDTTEDTAATLGTDKGPTESNNTEYTTEGQTRILQENVDLLSDNPLEKYRIQVNFKRANAVFCTEVFQLQDTADLADTGGTGKEYQLKKYSAFDSVGSIREVIREWRGNEETSIWLSETLAVDLGLPMRTPPIPETVQLLVLATRRPFLLVILFKERNHEIYRKKARDYCTEMSQLLTPLVHRFCSEDFALLPCAMSEEDVNSTELEEEIQQRIDMLGGFYGGPINVSKAAYVELRKAVVLTACTTSIPYHLDMKDLNPNEGQAWLLYLDEDWRNVMSLLIEQLQQTTCTLNLMWSPATEAKVKVALLEVARRLSFTEEVVIVSKDKQIHNCVERVAAETLDEYETKLHLKTVAQRSEHLSAKYVIGMDNYEEILTLPPSKTQCIIKLQEGSSTERHPTRPSFVRGYASPPMQATTEESRPSSNPVAIKPTGEGNTCDEVEEWVRQGDLSDKTLNVLKKHGFTSMEKVRHLKSVDVKKEFGDDLPLAERLALHEAIGRLPKASQRRHHETFRILLMGKSGSGKSSTGNTIMGKDVFPYGQSLQGITRKCEHRCTTKKNGLTIEIIDSPGLFDPDGTDNQEQEIVKTVALLDPGPTAVLYVVRFGRYTKEEFETYQRLKRLFGGDITRYVTIVFTGGDMLKKEHKSIDQCIREAGEDLSLVLRECQSRYVVFNNHDSKKNKKVSVNELLEKLRQSLRANGNKPYRSQIQERVGKQLEVLVQEKVRHSTKLKEFDKKISCVKKEANDYMSKLQKIEQELEHLNRRHDELEEKETSRIFQEKKKTEEIDDLKRNVEKLSSILRKKSNELEKLERQKQSEQEKEEVEEMKKTKATIAAEKNPEWVATITSTLTDIFPGEKSAKHFEMMFPKQTIKVAPMP